MWPAAGAGGRRGGAAPGGRVRWRSWVPCVLLACVVAIVGLNTLSFARRAQPLALGAPRADRRAAARGGPFLHAMARECLALHAQNGVIVGFSWGSLDAPGIERWRVLDCDRFVGAHVAGAAPTELAEEGEEGGAADEPGFGSAQQVARPSWWSGWAERGAPAGPSAAVKRCAALRRGAPGFLAGTSWGSMSEAEQQQWEALGCVHIEPALLLERAAEARYVASYGATLAAALGARTARLRKREGSADPVVAIGVSTTTRTLVVRRLSDLALFSIMLPSLAATAQVGFEYWLYLAHDVGDRFFEAEGVRHKVARWCQRSLLAPLRARGIEASVLLLRFNNTVRKPGPVFNFMMAAAAEDGADFLYRINDDTELRGADWTAQAVRALERMRRVGVVGPICDEGNVAILTHDMVHRTHLAIFGGLYYPPVLSDWYMDDWISRVYGQARTQKGPFYVTHHIGQHATRYAVDRAHEFALDHELAAGRAAIARWCAAHEAQCAPQEPVAPEWQPALALTGGGGDDDDSLLPDEEEDAGEGAVGSESDGGAFAGGGLDDDLEGDSDGGLGADFDGLDEQEGDGEGEGEGEGGGDGAGEGDWGEGGGADASEPAASEGDTVPADDDAIGVRRLWRSDD